MSLLTFQQVKDARDSKTVRVEVPEWGEGAYLFVRIMSSDELDSYNLSNLTGEDEGRKVQLQGSRARLVARCASDESGKRLFSDEDAAWLGAKSQIAVERIYEAAAKLNRIHGGAIEEAVKNSDGEASGASPSA